MWLPTPLYERIPQFWLLIGLLFMSSGTYLGFDYSLSFVYFGVGFVCLIWSVAVFVKRSRYRSDSTRSAIPTINEEDNQKQEQEQPEDQAETPAGHAS
jgi:hypothetical protein